MSTKHITVCDVCGNETSGQSWPPGWGVVLRGCYGESKHFCSKKCAHALIDRMITDLEEIVARRDADIRPEDPHPDMSKAEPHTEDLGGGKE